jgi:6-pyruvoyltetrahydropterin/6-carboxytetrahydropterin synthase
MMFITRREYFNAAHKVYNPDWDDAKNKEVFGGCANPNWHGHNYIIYVTVKGDIKKDTNFVVDLKSLSKLIKEHILDKVDHRNFNLDVPFMKDIMPSAENIAIAFWNQLALPVAELGGKLHSIKLQETENNYVEYFGEK